MDAAFTSHKLNETGLHRAQSVAEAFDNLLKELRHLGCIPNREFALARTHLEIAGFFAKKSMAVQPGFQEKP